VARAAAQASVVLPTPGAPTILAGGYTLAYGDWGNIDVIGGFRLLAVSERTDFGLSEQVIAPNGTDALNRVGGLSISRNN